MNVIIVAKFLRAPRNFAMRDPKVAAVTGLGVAAIMLLGAALGFVLRSPDEDRWASEGFVGGLDDTWNIAYFETRGIGETGWAPDLQWHVRRSAAWTGRTVASMRVYDVLRCLQALRKLGEKTSDDPWADPRVIAAAIEKGLLDAPQFQGLGVARGAVVTRMIDGACRAVDPSSGRPLTESERLARLGT